MESTDPLKMSLFDEETSGDDEEEAEGIGIGFDVVGFCTDAVKGTADNSPMVIEAEQVSALFNAAF